MAKHTMSDSEDELVSQSLGTSASAAKRARVSSLPPSSPPAQPSTTPDAGALADEGEEDEEEEDEDDEMENAEDAAITQQANRLAKKNANADIGALAESGIIMRVELTNFMCHKLHTSDFGPRINFIVGNNGSGKSAILTGLSMALGGSAKGSNRGKKGSDLVKEGESYATCAVRIKNGGVDAFKPSAYGRHITIERRINHDGGGSYKIKDEDGKVRCTKKSTLDAIVDHFNIQVENPMTILTQDQARQFLNTSSSADKYSFFLRGTQLAQLTTEYEIIRENTTSMENNLEKKMALVVELKAAYKRAKERGLEAQAAIDQSERVVELKNELAWSYVFEDEKMLEAAKVVLEKSEKDGEKIKEKLEEYEAKLVEAENVHADLDEAQLEADETCIAVSKTFEEKSAAFTQVNEEMKGHLKNQRDVKHEIGRMDNQIRDLLEQLKVEEAKLARDFNAERQERDDRKQQMTNENEKLRVELSKGQDRISVIDDEMTQGREEISGVKQRVAQIERHIAEAKGRLATLDKAKTTPLLKYGETVPKLVDLINREKGWIEKPIGPIGQYCKLKDPQYGAALESYFAGTLNAFLVTNPQDKQRLAKLHKQANCNHNQPIISQRDDPNFNFSKGEPSAEINTILRVLEIENKFVQSVLVNNRSTESAALVVKRAHGDDLMAKNMRNVQTCFSADLFRLGGVDGGAGSQAMSVWRGPARLTADTTAQRNDLQKTLQEAMSNHKHAKDAVDEIHQRLTQLQRERDGIDRKASKDKSKMRSNNAEIETLNRQHREEEPGNMAAVQEQLSEVQANKDTTMEQVEVLQGTINECKQRVTPAMQAREDAKKAVDDAAKLSGKVLKRMEQNTAEKLTQENNIKQYKVKLEDCEKRIADYILSAENFQKQLDIKIEQATTICAVRPNPVKKKTPLKLTQEIEAIEKALKEREKRQGATVDQILAEVTRRKEIAQEAVNTCNELSAFIKVLTESYDKRISRWTDFRDSIAHRAKMQFHYHLSRRNYTGKLTFNHDKGSLNLRVQIDPNATKSQKDAKGLSGGEKSFSTICLLLTMWEAVGCPIRCLDEFDVFMDALNRRVSMKMMVDTAKAADATQFILISPQSNNSGLDPSVVKVIKIQDPVRSQGVLQFGR